MKKKIIKIVWILILLSIFVILVNSSFCFEKVNPSNYEPADITGASQLTKIGNTIIGIIQLIGSLVSLIILIIIGIKYIIGSVEERAQYKETFRPYLIGAVLLFGITNILGIISDIVSEM